MRHKIIQNGRTIRTGMGYKARVIQKFIFNGYNVRKRGWPDLIVSKGHDIEAVYIIKTGWSLSNFQQDISNLLQRSGLKVSIYYGEG